MRCTSRAAPLGAPMQITLSTAPQSMPRSSVEVQTTARSPPLRHRRFHLAALLRRQRAVMQRDGKIVVVDAPQILEGALGLAARVDEDQRGLGRADRRHHIRHGVARQMPRPGHIGVRRAEWRSRGLAPPAAITSADSALAAFGLRHQKALQRRGIGHRRRQADAAMPGRQLRQPRQAQRQQIAALGIVERVQFVQHHRLAGSRTIAALRGWASSSANCSGVVSRKSGGAWRWRWRRAAAACRRCGSRPSPASPISATGVSRLRATSTASAFSGEI